MHTDTGRVWRILAGAAGTAIAAYGAKRIAASLGHATIEGEHVVTIRKQPSELYALWSAFERAPEWMNGVREVTRTGPNTTHWVVDAPGGTTIEYDAELIEELPGQRLAWKSTDDSSVQLYGETDFIETSRGTEVRTSVVYDAPIGLLGVAAAGMVGLTPSAMLKEHLRRFKMLAEAGEIATNESPSARRVPTEEPGTLLKRGFDVAEELSGKKTAAATREVRAQDTPRHRTPKAPRTDKTTERNVR